MNERGARGLAGHGVPDPNFRAAGQDQPALGRERDGGHLFAVHKRGSRRLAGRRIPQSGRAVGASGQDGPAIGAEQDVIDPSVVLEDCLEVGRLAFPGDQVGPRHPAEFRSLGRSFAECLGHPEQTQIGVAALGQAEAAIEVAGGDLGLCLGFER